MARVEAGIEGPDSRRLETQVILLSVAAAMLAWVMQALLDFYFHYWGDVSYPQLLLLRLPPREIYSRVAMTISFLFAGIIISRMVRRVETAEARWGYLYSCLRALRDVNHLITHVKERAGIVRGVCERLVQHRGFDRVSVALTGANRNIAADVVRESPSAETGWRVAAPLRYSDEVLGELIAILPAGNGAQSDERAFLEEVADDVAFALHSVGIDEERERGALVQRVLYQVATGLRVARTYDDLVDTVRYRISDVVDTSGLRVVFYDPDKECITEIGRPRGDGSLEKVTCPAAGSLPGFVAKTGLARCFDRSDIARLVEAGLVAEREDLPESWVGAPFEIGGEVRGVLSLRHDGEPSEGPGDELRILSFVADQLGECAGRLETERAVRAQSEQLQTILDTVPAYIYYKDAEGRYLKVNKALADMAGVPESRWSGLTFEEVLPEASGSGSWADQEVVRTGEPKFGAIEVLELDGRMLWLQTDRIPYRDHDGAVVGVIGLSIDVTERREMEAALAVKEEELRQSQKMEAIGLLAGGIAHDFNNLLTAILGYAELSLVAAEPGDPIAKNLSGIHEAADRAAALTRQLLAFGRRQALQLTTIDLGEAVEGVRTLLGRLIGEDVELVTAHDPGVPSICGDPAQVEQIIVNLAVNARDAMPDGGTLSIRAERVVLDEASCAGMPQARPGAFACLSVADTGTGMTDDVVAHIFEPFFTTKGPQAGTGLGLSVIYGNVHQHGGWIDVETAPGNGTTFRIFFPEATERARAVEPPPEAPPAAGGAGERILLVEDEELVRELAARVLRSKGYEVVDVRTAEEALESVENDGAFDLVLSDVVLPGMSGVQLAEVIGERSPGSRVLLCSGYADRRLQWPIIKERGIPFLDKPYSVAELLSSVRGVLQ